MLDKRTARTSGSIFRTLAAEYGTSDLGRCRYICRDRAWKNTGWFLEKDKP